MRTPVRIESGTNPDFIRQKGADTEATSGADTVEENLSHRGRESALVAFFYG